MAYLCTVQSQSWTADWRLHAMPHRFETVSETTLAAQKTHGYFCRDENEPAGFFSFYTETNLAISHPVYQMGTCIRLAGVSPGS